MDDDHHEEGQEPAADDEPSGKPKKRNVARVVHVGPTLFVDDAELLQQFSIWHRI